MKLEPYNNVRLTADDLLKVFEITGKARFPKYNAVDMLYVDAMTGEYLCADCASAFVPRVPANHSNFSLDEAAGWHERKLEPAAVLPKIHRDAQKMRRLQIPCRVIPVRKINS